jgi:leader peptidase (prepilin peptidase)/N-methyltransferase
LLAPPAALLWLASFAAFGVGHAIVAGVMGTALVVLSAFDLEQERVPNEIVLPAFALVLVLQLSLFPGNAAEWLLAPLLTAGLLALPLLAGRAWIGMGDVKLLLLLGAGLGWGVLGALFVGCLLVLPVALVLALRRGPAALKGRIPFVPFLSLGALIVLFAPHLGGFPAG